MITQILTALIGNYMTTAFVIGVDRRLDARVSHHRGHRTPGSSAGHS